MAISQKKRKMLDEQPKRGAALSPVQEVLLTNGGMAHRCRRQPLNMRPPKRRPSDR